MARIVAEQIVQLMLDAGVRRIYGVVGDALNPLVDAIRRDGTLECWGDYPGGPLEPPAGRFSEVSVDEYHACGIRFDGCGGVVAGGRCGIGTAATRCGCGGRAPSRRLTAW